mmetsp:Transcript_135838/g.249350  ORF Transcript_135838/g.249350 Transcript_135838/m.249350 type:complete len:219 (-) Transcript_135838:28-684(-)
MEEIALRQDDIVQAGFLIKESMYLRRLRSRWVVLTRAYLFSFKSEDAEQPTEFIRLQECSSIRSADHTTGVENSFHVMTPNRTFLLIAGSAIEKEVWMNAISNCCLPVLLAEGISHRLSRFAIVEAEEEGDELDFELPCITLDKAAGLKHQWGSEGDLSNLSTDVGSDDVDTSSSDNDESHDEIATEVTWTAIEQMSSEEEAAIVWMANCSLAAEYFF